MNMKTLLIVMCAIAFCSCSTAYRTTQTVDDVYYSPTVAGYVAAAEDKSSYNNQEILMGIQDARWRDFDNDYNYSPYSYGYNCDYYYNPYYCAYPVYATTISPGNPVNTTPRMTDLSAYKNINNNSYQAMNLNKTNAIKQQKAATVSNDQPSALGNFFRNMFTVQNNTDDPYNNTNSSSNNSSYNSSNNTSNSNYNNRNYTPSSSGSSGSASSEPARPARNGH